MLKCVTLKEEQIHDISKQLEITKETINALRKDLSKTKVCTVLQYLQLPSVSTATLKPVTDSSGPSSPEQGSLFLSPSVALTIHSCQKKKENCGTSCTDILAGTKATEIVHCCSFLPTPGVAWDS